ncbi:ATP-binding protein [Georgenia sp. Marseille-Q6866]
MPPEQQGRIFERFAQVTGPQRRPAGGSGLGLSIVAAIAAGHGRRSRGWAPVRGRGRGGAWPPRAGRGPR